MSKSEDDPRDNAEPSNRSTPDDGGNDEPSTESSPESVAAGSNQSGEPPSGESPESDDESSPVGSDEETENIQDDELPDWEPLTPELVEDEAVRGDFVLRWAVVLLAFLAAFTAVLHADVLVHVKTGQVLTAHGFRPWMNDPFAYTLADRPWVNLSWLYDLLAAGLFQLGAGGLTILKAVIAATAFGFLVHTGRSGVSTWWGSICAALALLACLPQLTARPEVVSLLGTAVTLWLLNRWHETGGGKYLWSLAGMFVLWSNLDERMFLGLAIVLLYAVGLTVDGALGRCNPDQRPRIKPLWIAVGGCFVAALVNPFHIHSLTAPYTLYAVEYPALRLYNVVVDSAKPLPGRLQYYSLFNAAFWKWPDFSSIAGLLLILTASISMALNRARFQTAHLLVLLGGVAFALATEHELAVAAIICSALATLNAQEWYRDHFRQTYSVAWSELLFSRGGRAVTVLSLFALAYLSISGRLQGIAGPRTGFGLDSRLQARIDGLTADLADSFDDRPFNLSSRQGDVLIWIGQQVFVDSRLGLYNGKDDNNLLALHQKTRVALRNSGRRAAPQTGLETDWKTAFDRFQLTHALPRLTGHSPDYSSYFSMRRDVRNWQLTRLGSACAVFYRRDLKNPELTAYLQNRQVDFVSLAFRNPEKQLDVLPQRPDWARPRSRYENLLSLPHDRQPNAIQLAHHYFVHIQLAGQSSIRLSTANQVALAYLSIRNANRGLTDDPQNSVAYQILGAAYELLSHLERQLAGPLGNGRQTRRFYQAEQAYQQALRLQPGNAFLYDKLARLYAANQKIDLAAQALDRFDAVTETETDPSESLIRLQSDHTQLRDRLSPIIDKVDTAIKKLLDRKTNRLAVAQAAYQNGCVLKALGILDEDPDAVAKNPAAQLLRAILLLEAGRSEQASEILGRLEGYGQEGGFSQWRVPAAMTSLAMARYDRAIDLWRDEIDSSRMQSLSSALNTLPMVNPSRFWPIRQTSQTSNLLYRHPLQAVSRMLDVALCQLEAGRDADATKTFQRILGRYPETPARTLIAFYLYLLTDKIIDLNPPSNRIPITPDLFVPEPKTLKQKPSAKR